MTPLGLKREKKLERKLKEKDKSRLRKYIWGVGGGDAQNKNRQNNTHIIEKKIRMPINIRKDVKAHYIAG